MMPNLKASDFDYIIFDMPRLAPDESHMGDGCFYGQAFARGRGGKEQPRDDKARLRKLIAERNNVSVVVNKARSYVPKWLDAES